MLLKLSLTIKTFLDHKPNSNKTFNRFNLLIDEKQHESRERQKAD